MALQKKPEKSRIKIVPAHLWPSLFLTIGVYDVLHDLIFIKGGLPKITSRQTSKHENVHRKWFQNHPHARKLYVFLYYKPAFYFILSALFIAFYHYSILFLQMSMALLSTLLCLFTLIFFHYCLHERLEQPARKVSGFLPMGLPVKELLRLVVISLVPVFLLLPTIFAFQVLDLRKTLIVLGLGFFWIWAYQFTKIRAIKNLQKKVSS